MAQVKTSHYEIFKYWRNKWIYQDGKISEGFSPVRKVPCELVVEDWGEPCCWGCGRIAGKFHREREYESWLQNEEGYKKIWNNKRVVSDLNRCHIVPNSLKGEDAPHNLFLMCPECHQMSPDTDNIESFFRWVYKRRKTMCMGKLMPTELMSMVDVELTEEGYPNIDGILTLANINVGEDQLKDILMSHDLKQYLKAHAGTHGPAIQDSTFMYCVTDYLKDIYEQTLSAAGNCG